MPAPNPPPQETAPPFPRFWAALLLWGILLVATLYAPSLTLPFFFDDLVHLPYVTSTPAAQMLQATGGLAYYRPLSFIIWRLLYLLLGAHSPLLHHALNLLLHLLTGLLVGYLASVLWQQRPGLRTALSATLFWLYPFSYQAVPWSGAVVHPLVTALLLLALFAYLQWRRGGGRGWLLLSLAPTVLAPFAHENGVLVGPAVVLVALAWRGLGEVRIALKHGLLWLLPALLWMPLWSSVPKGVDASVGLNGLESTLQNSVYLLQGMAYPLSFLGGWLVRRGVNDMLAALLLALPALAFAAFIQWRSDSPRRLALLPWLWCLLAWAPALLVLNFGYVVGSPRLLMLASVGVAWLWTDVTVHLLPAPSRAIRLATDWAVLVSAAVLLLLLQNAMFIRTRMRSHLLLGAAVDQAVVLTARANGQGREALFLNFPTWTAPRTQVYALGHEGVVLWPAYAPQEAIVSAQTGQPASLHLAEYTDIRPPVPYYLGTVSGGPVWDEVAAARAQVFVAVPEGATVDIQPAGLFDPPSPDASPLARFDDGESVVRLLAAEAYAAGGTTTVTLTWQVESPPPGPITVFMHLLDEAGQLIAQDDGHPLAGTYPFLLWTPGQITADVRLLKEVGAVVMVGLYDPVSGQRLSGYDASGEPLPDGALRVGIR
jgi:hypothetical protein